MFPSMLRMAMCGARALHSEISKYRATKEAVSLEGCTIQVWDNAANEWVLWDGSYND